MPYKDRETQIRAQKRHYEHNKARYRERNQKRRKRRQEWIDRFLDDMSCFFCQEKANESLDFHHINPEDKEEIVSRLIKELRSTRRIVEEIEKCVLLCANCHRKLHRGTIKFTFKQEHCCHVPDELRTIVL